MYTKLKSLFVSAIQPYKFNGKLPIFGNKVRSKLACVLHVCELGVGLTNQCCLYATFPLSSILCTDS